MLRVYAVVVTSVGQAPTKGECCLFLTGSGNRSCKVFHEWLNALWENNKILKKNPITLALKQQQLLHCKCKQDNKLSRAVAKNHNEGITMWIWPTRNKFLSFHSLLILKRHATKTRTRQGIVQTGFIHTVIVVDSLWNWKSRFQGLKICEKFIGSLKRLWNLFDCLSNKAKKIW